MNALTLGILFALLAALSSGIEKIFRRHVAIKVDVITYAFFFNLIAALVMLPFYLSNFQIPDQTISWALLLIPSFLWAGTGFFMFKAYTHLESSVAAPISRIKILIVLALSVIFLNETLNTEKLWGTLIIFAGLFLLSHKKSGQAVNWKNIGVYFLLISITITSVAHIIEKAGLLYINVETYAFWVYFIPMLVFLPFFLVKKVSFKEVYKTRFWSLAITAILSSAFHFFILIAFNFTEASIVIPFSELSNLIAVMGGIIFLNEKDHMAKKIVSTVIIIVGTVLISLS